MSKYEFIKVRLKELGKTQTEFADALGITQQKLNVTLNKPELREFQNNEILKAADFLGYSYESFLKCVTGILPEPTIEPKTIGTADILMIADIVSEYLAKNGFKITPEQKVALIDRFYQQNITDANKIKEMLSFMQSMDFGSNTGK
jgi:transcriptional regulator with XRE-family HTH domain